MEDLCQIFPLVSQIVLNNLDDQSLTNCKASTRRLKESLEDEQYNKPRWIDTSTMICDPLTNHGHEQFAARLVSTMDAGILNMVASASSELKKMRAQKARLDRIRGADQSEE